jgi:hypothetical protein
MPGMKALNRIRILTLDEDDEDEEDEAGIFEEL